MPARRSSSQPNPPSNLTHFLSRPWVPIVFFALLTAGYFYHILITGDVIYGSDTGAEFHKGNEPFAEALSKLPQKNWSRFMGGTPESAALRAQYYPLVVIDLFTSEHRYFGWRYIFAMFTAGYFMYLCARSFGLHPLAALIAGAAYASAPAFLSFSHAGHYAKMTVIGLFPLMYWALNRGMDTRRIIYFLILGGTVGIAIYSPHLQMAYFALWALGLLFLYKLIRDLSRNGTKIALYQTLLSAGAICLGLAIGAEGVIPQYWNTKTSSKRAATEQEDGYEFASSWSLHPEEIFALVIPEFASFDTNTTPHKYWGRNAFKINSEYVGIVPLFFAIIALTRIRKKNPHRIPPRPLHTRHSLRPRPAHTPAQTPLPSRPGRQSIARTRHDRIPLCLCTLRPRCVRPPPPHNRRHQPRDHKKNRHRRRNMHRNPPPICLRPFYTPIPVAKHHVDRHTRPPSANRPK